MAALIAGVLWRAGRPSELAYRHTRMHPPLEPSMYLPIGRAVRRTAGALFYRTGRRGSDAAERPSNSEELGLPLVSPGRRRRVLWGGAKRSGRAGNLREGSQVPRRYGEILASPIAPASPTRLVRRRRARAPGKRARVRGGAPTTSRAEGQPKIYAEAAVCF